MDSMETKGAEKGEREGETEAEWKARKKAHRSAKRAAKRAGKGGAKGGGLRGTASGGAGWAEDRFDLSILVSWVERALELATGFTQELLLDELARRGMCVCGHE
jgi:hypothetical protein